MGSIPTFGIVELKRTRQLGDLAHTWDPAPRSAYLYLLGMYLGDGCISPAGRTLKLRIFLDAGYPQIVEECRQAIAAVMPTATAGVSPKRPWRCVEVYGHSVLWPDLIPQHGVGPKHLRPIALEGWQRQLVEMSPEPFIRGLFHSDGSYFQNPVRAKTGKRYSYDRYSFTNVSEDIKALFQWACSLIDVESRPANRKNISVARRSSVARLNEFLGPKR